MYIFDVIPFHLEKSLVIIQCLRHCTKKWSYPLRISSVNMTKSTGFCGFGCTYWRNPQWKISFFCAVRTVKLVDFFSDRFCLQSQRVLADILWKFPGNGQGRRPFSVSCRFMETSMVFFLFNNFKSWRLQ